MKIMESWANKIETLNRPRLMNRKTSPKFIFVAIRRVHPSACTRWSIRFLWGQNNEGFSVFVLAGNPWQCTLLVRWRSNHISNSNNPKDFFVSSSNSPKHRSEPPSFLFNGHRTLSSRSVSGQRATLTLQLYLMSKVLKSEDLPLLPHMSSCCVQKQM